MDLRHHVIPPYGERNEYVNNAVTLHTFDVPCSLLETDGKSEKFWKVAAF
jgi:hypothetical protein